MFQALKEKLAALRERLTSSEDKEEAQEKEKRPAKVPPPAQAQKTVFKKKKAAAKAAAAAVEAPVPPAEQAKALLKPSEPAPREPAAMGAVARPKVEAGEKGAEGRPKEDEVKEEEEESPFASSLFGWKLREGKLDSLLWDLELALLESDVALPVVEAVKKRVKKDLLDKRVKLGMDVAQVVEDALKDSITSVLAEPVDLPPKARRAPSRFQPPFFYEFIDKKNKPVVLMFVGINGTGKTTTIAKIAHLLLKQGYTCVIGAGDTFRAGAIEQLEKHADKLGIKLVKHLAGSDPASVAFDTIEHAKARKKDVVLIDTAGRMQTDTGLMEEMTKIERVAKPDLVIYVGDALAGNDAVNEAMAFNRAVGIDAVVLTKVDADAKGGAALSIRYATGAPVIFVGTGQEYKDLEPFSPAWMVDRIFGDKAG